MTPAPLAPLRVERLLWELRAEPRPARQAGESGGVLRGVDVLDPQALELQAVE